jgi:hypothetical protein
LRALAGTSRFPFVSRRVASCTSRAFLASAAVWIALLASGCGHRSESRQVHEAGSDRKVHIKLGEGAFDELTILRGSDGRFIVAGVCLFPEDTRLDISVADSAGAQLGHSQAVVRNALIQTLPFGPEAPPTKTGTYTVQISATFVPGIQSDPVMRAMGDGKQFQGEGMTRTRQGRLAYDRSWRVRL